DAKQRRDARIEVAARRQRVLDRRPLLHRVGAQAGIERALGDDQGVALSAVLAGQHLAELRRERGSPLAVDRVLEGAAKHAASPIPARPCGSTAIREMPLLAT